MDVEYFSYGLRGVLSGMGFALRQLFSFPLFQGFLVGFLFSTILHAFLIKDDYLKLPKFLWGDVSKRFAENTERKENGEYLTSYLQFKRLAFRTRIAFFLGVFVFGLIVIVSLFLV